MARSERRAYGMNMLHSPKNEYIAQWKNTHTHTRRKETKQLCTALMVVPVTLGIGFHSIQMLDRSK